MLAVIGGLCLLILALLPQGIGWAAPVRATLAPAYAQLPLAFEANQGQTDPAVHFLARGLGYTLFLTGTEAVLVMRPGTGDGRPGTGDGGRDQLTACSACSSSAPPPPPRGPGSSRSPAA